MDSAKIFNNNNIRESFLFFKKLKNLPIIIFHNYDSKKSKFAKKKFYIYQIIIMVVKSKIKQYNNVFFALNQYYQLEPIWLQFF